MSSLQPARISKYTITFTFVLYLWFGNRDVIAQWPNLVLQLNLISFPLEIVAKLDPELYKSGRCFLGTSSSSSNSTAQLSALSKPVAKFKKPVMSSGGKVMAVAASVSAVKPPTARHDPMMEGSLVMLRPSKTHQAKWNTGKRPLVDVVVDPLLCAHLREHQRQGVKYLYECVMGMKDYNGQGAILADEMGLGKTLQSIALLWTLLKQNPYHGNQPVVKRALIVCPTTLINNWRHEFKKWLGDERIRVFVVDSKANLSNFLHGRIYSVMIIGYEKLRNVQESLKDAQFDIVIWLGFNFILFTSVLNVKMPLFY
ncbi:P-loop containing nucleoside triphosphate hydrolase protein [Jimgerdemannia flammicorona]|uniref:P-loop containing nucleoside triphosphate hydrolase protein n=1 Tax=Jimgerdemannia flammicorona TaxID=994334 RepID=A0A433DF63_9FUNG|nr:P-loop containing nucleoside triphosphate hydrolase protein [Jimgerdemannia flammicorona]